MSVSSLCDTSIKDVSMVNAAKKHVVNREWLLAGDAIFTIEVGQLLKNCERKPHYTYRIVKVEANDPFPESFFVKILVGQDNESDYAYLGKLNASIGEVKVTPRSSRPADSFEIRLLNRILPLVWLGKQEIFEPHGFKIHNEGKCGKCGKTLTTPLSCERGIGPECWKKMQG